MSLDQSPDGGINTKENIEQLSRLLHENLTGINYKLGSLESIEKTSKSLRKVAVLLTVVTIFLAIFSAIQIYVFLVLIGIIPG